MRVKTQSIFSIALLSIVGCGKWGVPVPGTKMSGDLVAFVLQCSSARGGHPDTNGLRNLDTTWTVQSNLVQHRIFVHGDHFDEIESMLSKMFGTPDKARGSSPATRIGNYATRSGWYGIGQTEIGIAFSGDATQTVICIDGRLTP